ncbi:MAG: acyl-CoA thioesterase [Candidatus Tectomicrobia bacterium]|uniref:Acyl-CoA thioesterase n=1 Tax=Tectimicrobiota bacterium TaxID=2528274 RepID=A0A932M200_UNCTE|nr:acyl-CoA thioesterase [Candidatus Tectomicrobia bacterium]
MVEQIEHMRVSWIDTDAAGRIHYASVLRYFEAAEHELLRTLGIPYTRILRKLGFPRVEVWARFKKPLYYDDEIDVHCRIEKVGRSSVIFGFQIFKQDLLSVEGGLTIVAINGQGKPVSHPAYFRKSLAKGLFKPSRRRKK